MSYRSLTTHAVDSNAYWVDLSVFKPHGSASMGYDVRKPSFIPFVISLSYTTERKRGAPSHNTMVVYCSIVRNEDRTGYALKIERQKLNADNAIFRSAPPSRTATCRGCLRAVGRDFGGRSSEKRPESSSVGA